MPPKTRTPRVATAGARHVNHSGKNRSAENSRPPERTQVRDLAAAVVLAQDGTLPCRCEHVIEVSPHIRPDGTKHPNLFDARLAGSDEVLCVSDTPLLMAARMLLKAGRADPDDAVVMRHAGSSVIALRGPIGLAASLTIEETGFGPKPRRYKPRPCLEGLLRIAQTPPTAPEPLPGETALYDIPCTLPGVRQGDRIYRATEAVIAMTVRQRLPNRRASETFTVEFAGLNYTATISRFADGKLAEVFLTNHRATSDAGAAASDSAVLASIALQYGVPVDVIRKALMRDAHGHARTPLGMVLDMIAECDR